MAVHRRPKQKIDEDEEGALATLAVRASDVMALAGFETVMEFNPRRRRDVDFFAQKTDEFGNVRRIAITCALEANPFEQTEQHTTFNDDDEDWLVVGKVFSDSVRESLTANKRPFAKLFAIEELEAAVEISGSAPKAKARSKIAKAVLTNEAQITVATAAVALLIAEKITSLNAERPNSDEATVRRDKALTEYEALRSKVTELQTAVASFKAGTLKEPALTKTVHSFRSGVRSWWNKSHKIICEKAYEAGLFTSLVLVCEMTGANANVSVLVSAALAGGKPIMGVLKSVGRKLVGP